MKKLRLTAIIAALAILLSGCSLFSVEEEDATEPEYASMPESSFFPVSKEETVNYYNTVLGALRSGAAFTEEDKPGVAVSDSIDVYDIELYKVDESGNKIESDDLEALKASAKAVKSRILDGLDLGVEPIERGDMTRPLTEVIAPVGQTDVTLEPHDAVKTDAGIDGGSLNLTLVMTENPESIAKVYDARDPAEVIKNINEQSGEYCVVEGYEKVYANRDATEDVSAAHSVVELTVALDKDADGNSYSSGRATRMKTSVTAFVTAQLSFTGPFEKYGSVTCAFTMTETREYTFEW